MLLFFCGIVDEKLFADRDEGRIIPRGTNATKFENDKSHAPHLYLAKAFRANAAKAKHAKSFAPFIKTMLIGIEKERNFMILLEKGNKRRKMRVSKEKFLPDY